METPKWFVEYCKTKNQEWQESIQGKVVIFLDTKMLIRFRECVQHKSLDDPYCKIYERLKILVQNGKAICPLTESVNFELLKRQTKEDVVLIFDIANSLSRSLMQTNIPAIAENETLAFHNLLRPPLIVNKIQSQYITFPLCDDSNQAAIENNKAILDRFMATNMADLYKLMVPDPQFYRDGIQQLFGDLKKSILAGEKGKYRSFQSLRAFEFRSALAELYFRLKGKWGLRNDFVERAMSCRHVAKYMPFTYNMASMYAWVRWSELNNLETNDIFDLTTFPCAIGYGDYLFAEKKYTNRIKQKPLQLDKDSGTVVEHDEERILGILDALAGNQSAAST